MVLFIFSSLPLFEKNCLLLSGNESFQDVEKDIEALTGIKVSHSTLQRLVHRQEYEEPQTLQGVSEISIDGGKVRLRSQIKGVGSYWRDYKAARLQGMYGGAFFQDNLSLIDWINSQRLLSRKKRLKKYSQPPHSTLKITTC